MPSGEGGAPGAAAGGHPAPKRIRGKGDLVPEQVRAYAIAASWLGSDDACCACTPACAVHSRRASASGLQEQVLSTCLVLNSCSVALRLVQEKAQLGAAMAEGAVTGILPPVRASATARAIRGAHKQRPQPSLPGLHQVTPCLFLCLGVLQDEATKGAEAEGGPSVVKGTKKMAEGAAEVANAAGKATADAVKAAAATTGA